MKTYFFYADEGLIAEAGTTGNIIKTYGYRPDVTWSSDPLYLKEGASIYYFQNDILGASQKLISQNGQVVWSAKAESFGSTTVDPSSTIANNLRFPGQYYDAESGLHYNWNRYYDPRVGRYLTSDPIGIAADTNVYSYAYQNPVKFIDPEGLRPNQGPPMNPSPIPPSPFPPGTGQPPSKARDGSCQSRLKRFQDETVAKIKRRQQELEPCKKECYEVCIKFVFGPYDPLKGCAVAVSLGFGTCPVQSAFGSEGPGVWVCRHGEITGDAGNSCCLK
jgi:RHS repeat-associated protein